jgi:hypothetical protein
MPLTVKIDVRQAVKDLKTFRASALPFAIRNSLNASAFLARKEWQQELRESFTLRNKYTERSVLVERASGKVTGAMVAKVGSVAPYMLTQEQGGTVRGRSGHKGIPTAPAAGQGEGAARTKLVRAGNRLSALNLRKAHGATKKQRNAVALAMARRRGERVVLLERPRGGKGIFRLMGGRRKLRVRMLWDFSRGSVQVPAEPTLQRTLAKIQPRMEHIHVASVLEQLRRHKILGY